VACLASPAAAQQSAHVGMRLGVDVDSKDMLISTHATIPVTTMLDFYPSIDVHLPDEGTRTALNGDVRFRLPTNQGPDLYVGGGLNVLLRNVRDQSDTDLGLKGLFGMESRSGWIHPFLEGRLVKHDNTSFQFIGGVNFTFR
jgi:hypothetical protein